MTRCHICERPCVYEVEPAVGDQLPAVTEPDVWTVTLRNGLRRDACLDCSMKWPDDHKLFPDEGFGRSTVVQLHRRGRTRVEYDERGELVAYELLPRNSIAEDAYTRTRREPTNEDIVQVLRETAP